MVERTAHNGLVVGSIPTKLRLITKYNKIIYMNYEICKQKL